MEKEEQQLKQTIIFHSSPSNALHPQSKQTNIKVVMAAMADDVASNPKHHGLTQLFRYRVQAS
jgi:hypothetical protein